MRPAKQNVMLFSFVKKTIQLQYHIVDLYKTAFVSSVTLETEMHFLLDCSQKNHTTQTKLGEKSN